MKFLFALICACAVVVAGEAQVSIQQAASGSGVVAPGCAAVIRGSGFAVEANQTLQYPLPTVLGGVSVRIGDAEASLYAVSPTEIRLIVPDQPRKVIGRRGAIKSEEWGRSAQTVLLKFRKEAESLSLLQRSLIRWLPVEIRTMFGRQVGWVAVAPAAPGFYEQLDPAGRRVPQGQYVADGQAPRLLTADAVVNADTVLMLVGTGFRRAKSVQVFIFDELDGYWVVQAAVGKVGLFDLLEQVNFAIPSDAHGKLTIVAQADAMSSNAIYVTVR
jgi:hypothetical protein